MASSAMDGASEEWLANNPHFVFGCDFCTAVETDGSAYRIRGPVRYSKPGADVDCCPTCFERQPADEQKYFVKLPPDPEPPPAAEPPPAPAPAPTPAENALYAVALMPADGPMRQKAEDCIQQLCTAASTKPFDPHIMIVTGFRNILAAETAARAAASSFRDADGVRRLTLKIGPLREDAKHFKAVTAAAMPSKLFGDALLSAEAVRRQIDAPGDGDGSYTSARAKAMAIGIHNPPCLSLLYSPGVGRNAVQVVEPPIEAEALSAAVSASNANDLIGMEFEGECCVVLDVSAGLNEYSEWSTVLSVPIIARSLHDGFEGAHATAVAELAMHEYA